MVELDLRVDQPVRCTLRIAVRELNGEGPLDSNRPRVFGELCQDDPDLGVPALDVFGRSLPLSDEAPPTFEP